jgi:hypothetical protein
VGVPRVRRVRERSASEVLTVIEEYRASAWPSTSQAGSAPRT